MGATKEEWLLTLSTLPNWQNIPLKDEVFTLMDTRADNFLDFEEYVAAVSVMARGTVDERLTGTLPFFNYYLFL